MIAFARVALLLGSFSVIGCGQGSEPVASMDQGAGASTVVRYAELPARLCLDIDPARVEDVRKGRMRLWLQLRNRSAAARYSPPFTVSAIGADGAPFWQETFAMHVDHVGTADGTAQPQRFLFRLSDTPAGAGAGGRICFEIDRAAIDQAAVDDADAQLEIGLRWQEAAAPAQ